ncbi:glycosyltransferase [Methylomonas sp. EFPC3]|uniref:glycosyltransferase n=1 Tax=Methylomonas sp. EFPC3 TaxID=3021710 RepID=UPI002417F78A|nr:glycosyltransferase [Methylomonas sp. EFPC3]WFP50754.1 glycosyltransferase [Methylomonas sp. EFPC3]
MKSDAKRVLIFAEAVTLAHVARCATIAEELSASGKYEVILAVDQRFQAVSRPAKYRHIEIESVLTDEFLKKLNKGSPLYSVKTLEKYVQEELRIFSEFSPDFVIGDFRLSLAISCRLAEIPYATVTNAYWSPYIETSYPIPELPITKIFGEAVAQKMFDLVRPAVFALHSLAFNRACKKFGLPPLAYDMREVYTHADFTLYADIESLFSMRDLPKNHFFIGPILWSADVDLPDWWWNLPEDKPIVFVTLGSSGNATLLPMILETLSKMPLTVVCATAQRSNIEVCYPNVFIADYLPAEHAVSRCDLVVCNGGSPMVYQSLASNKPVLGLPSNLDQYLMMSTLRQSGRGYLIRSGQADPITIRRAVEQALTNTPENLAGECHLHLDKIIDLIEGKMAD